MYEQFNKLRKIFPPSILIFFNINLAKLHKSWLNLFLAKPLSFYFPFCLLTCCLFQQVQKLQNIISSRASQYSHDMKRKEREFNKLKERLNQLLTDKKERKQGKMHNFYSNNQIVLLKAYSLDNVKRFCLFAV